MILALLQNTLPDVRAVHLPRPDVRAVHLPRPDVVLILMIIIAHQLTVDMVALALLRLVSSQPQQLNYPW